MKFVIHSFLLLLGAHCIYSFFISTIHKCSNILPGQGHRNIHSKICSTKENKANLGSVETSTYKPMDLTGCSLWVDYTGFGVKNMTFAMEFQANNKVKFCKGLGASNLGFWRTLAMTDGSGNDLLEATHPLLPEHMYFFDIFEPQILWRGVIDKVNKKVINGEVLTNKKRFGLFPYTEIIATYSANIYLPNQKLPEVHFPDSKDVKFYAPVGFKTPLDMKRFPEIFDPEFVSWWFAVEDAMAKGLEPPPRPKPFFVPKPIVSEDVVSGKSFRAKK